MTNFVEQGRELCKDLPAKSDAQFSAAVKQFLAAYEASVRQPAVNIQCNQS